MFLALTFFDLFLPVKSNDRVLVKSLLKILLFNLLGQGILKLNRERLGKRLKVVIFCDNFRLSFKYIKVLTEMIENKVLFGYFKHDPKLLTNS